MLLLQLVVRGRVRLILPLLRLLRFGSGGGDFSHMLQPRQHGAAGQDHGAARAESGAATGAGATRPEFRRGDVGAIGQGGWWQGEGGRNGGGGRRRCMRHVRRLLLLWMKETGGVRSDRADTHSGKSGGGSLHG